MSNTASQQSNPHKLLGHPKGLFVLFFTEMWERFSFYGMRFILVLFLKDNIKGGFGWSESAALTTFGLYCMFVYLAGIPGGIIAERYIGKKRAVLIGGIFQCIGHFLLVFKSITTFFLALAALVIGTGLIKSNISALVGSLYEKGDPQKDKGFGIFYMGINIGSLLAGFTIAIIGQNWGWHYGFSLAGIGMLLGIGTYVGFQHYVPNPKGEAVVSGGMKKISFMGLISSLAVVVLFLGIYYAGYTERLAAFIQNNEVLLANLIAIIVGLAIVAYVIMIMISRKEKVEKDRIIALVIALFLVFMFFVGFEQAGGLMTLYTDNYTDRSLWGWIVPSSAVQNLNPIFVVLCSVGITSLLVYFKKRSKNVNATFQMALGNIIMGLGFLFMIGACLQRRGALDPATAKSSLGWLVGAYLFHTLGELCLSPVILSFATNMSPKRYEGAIMGIVFAVIGLSNHFAAQLGALSESYGELTIFQIAFAIPVALGTLFILFNKNVIALTHGAEGKTKKKK